MPNDSIGRRDFLRTLAPLFALAYGHAAQAKRPNVLFLLTDDQRWDLLSLRGHPFLKTPNMDRVGREGGTFVNAFATTALCSPARASFLTGRYACQHGVHYNAPSETFDRVEKTFPRLLREAGYHTGYVGKWHIGEDPSPRPGFDYWASWPGQGVYLDPVMNINGKTSPQPGHVDDIVARLAGEFIRSAPADRPFCLNVGIKSPHHEHIPPADLAHELDDIPIPKPPSWFEDYAQSRRPDVVKNACLQVDRFHHGPEPLKGGWEPYIRDFYRCILSADRAVGRIVGALEERGILDHTVVIFAGDNGFSLGEHHLVSKRFPYEENIRIPLLMRYPKVIRPGTVIEDMVLNIDVCPTVLDFCGAPVPSNVAGRSVRPLLGNRASVAWRRQMFNEYAERIWGYPALTCVRTERYKYIEYVDPASTNELYDLLLDPREMRNVIAEARYGPVLADMRNRLIQLKKEAGWKPPVATGPNTPCPPLPKKGEGAK